MTDTTEMTTQVVVLGAGYAGLIAALRLALAVRNYPLAA